MRSILVVNQSTVVGPDQFAAGLAAVQQQVHEHFAPPWGGLDAQLIPGEAGQLGEVLYVLDDTDQADALGYHEVDPHGQPVGFVFARTALQAGDSWTATLSHEVLEQLLDPLCRQTVVVPWSRRPAAVAYEVCDPVENDEYQLGGFPVSNFVFPHWFDPGPVPAGQRVDYLGRLVQPLTLSPGGYVAYSTNLKTWLQTVGIRCPNFQRLPARFSRRSRRFAGRARLVP